MKELVVALDVETAAEARGLASTLAGTVGAFKIGSRLFTAEGPEVVRALVGEGHRVFLDLKYHDIPNTVAGAVAAAARLGVWMLNVHASGGSAMMRAAGKAAADAGAGAGGTRPLVIAVTVLTSLDQQALGAVGVGRDVVDQVDLLGALVQDAGLDGVVASPRETARLRQARGAGFLIVTPGIRGPMAPGARRDDQARTLGAREALDAGADYIVVGRPIIEARDPREAALRLAEEAGRG
ncbi:MAG TPA: orotidine-5'-phosphate decarboxylase [Vicinamibacterales bacterium]|nr:orotidine-5'-phosphate decarboxylase [Vicinamibacterales bacterium]